MHAVVGGAGGQRGGVGARGGAIGVAIWPHLSGRDCFGHGVASRPPLVEGDATWKRWNRTAAMPPAKKLRFLWQGVGVSPPLVGLPTASG